MFGNMMAYQVINAQLFQLQHNRAQVRPQDLWVSLLLQVLLEGGLSIQPEALARLCTPGTPSPLMSAGLHDNSPHWTLLTCAIAASSRRLSSTCKEPCITIKPAWIRLSRYQQVLGPALSSGSAMQAMREVRVPEAGGNKLPTFSCPEV